MAPLIFKGESMSEAIGGLFSLFFSFAWIFGIFMVIKTAAKNGSKSGRNGNSAQAPGVQGNTYKSNFLGTTNQPAAPGQRMQQSSPYKGTQQRNSGSNMPVYGGSSSYAGNTTAKGSTGNTINRGASGNSPSAMTYLSMVDTDGDGKISTTEYLAQKAREDEAEHRKDEYMTKQKLTQGGTLRLGLRIPDDGILPRGTRIVYCGYCGADNVVPNGVSEKGFHCYFCHEQL